MQLFRMGQSEEVKVRSSRYIFRGRALTFPSTQWVFPTNEARLLILEVWVFETDLQHTIPSGNSRRWSIHKIVAKATNLSKYVYFQSGAIFC